MRQGSTVETKGNSLTFDILLSDQSRDLRDVNIVSFGSRDDHVFNVIFDTNMLVQKFTDLRPTVIK
jgi:hypothetical protein